MQGASCLHHKTITDAIIGTKNHQQSRPLSRRHDHFARNWAHDITKRFPTLPDSEDMTNLQTIGSTPVYGDNRILAYLGNTADNADDVAFYFPFGSMWLKSNPNGSSFRSNPSKNG